MKGPLQVTMTTCVHPEKKDALVKKCYNSQGPKYLSWGHLSRCKNVRVWRFVKCVSQPLEDGKNGARIEGLLGVFGHGEGRSRQ